MKTTLKEIKNYFPATNVSDWSDEQLASLVTSRTIVAYSVGAFGVNGLVFIDYAGNLYKIIGRVPALFKFL